jgi:hypothetical protein
MIAPVNQINVPCSGEKEVTFRLEANLAQYKGSDYSNAVRVERNITLERAKEIAARDENIDYFVYLKGGCMVLEIPPGVEFDPNNDPLGLVTYNQYIFDDGHPGAGACRIFQHGDVVFFKKEGEWLGTAPGLADVYYKQ